MTYTTERVILCMQPPLITLLKYSPIRSKDWRILLSAFDRMYFAVIRENKANMRLITENKSEISFYCDPDRDIRVFYLDRQFFSSAPDKDIRVFYLDRQFFSSAPDKDIRVFYLDRQFLSYSCYLIHDRKKNHMNLMLRSQVTWIFIGDDVKK